MWTWIKNRVGDLADLVPADVVAGQFRHVVGGIGWLTAYQGMVGDQAWQYGLGVAAALLAHSWSWLQKLNDPQPPANP